MPDKPIPDDGGADAPVVYTARVHAAVEELRTMAGVDAEFTFSRPLSANPDTAERCGELG